MYPPAKKGSLTIPTPSCTCSRARRRPACIPSCDIHHFECVNSRRPFQRQHRLPGMDGAEEGRLAMGNSCTYQ
jgi:hypothetical protein